MDSSDNLILNWQEAYAAGPAVVGARPGTWADWCATALRFRRAWC